MKIQFDRVYATRDPMIYGQFLENFHRQIYGGVYDPGSSLANEHGLRTDVIDACRQIGVPVIRWPGGCFVSAYHWKEAVGPNRKPSYNKAWCVEEPNTFGTAEFYELCKALGCEMYLCSNAGTGTMEEMNDWLEYCNLESEGRYAGARIAHGYTEPFGVKYFSIGNENYADWDLFSHKLGETVVDLWDFEAHMMDVMHKDGQMRRVPVVDAIATKRSDGACVLSLINKHPEKEMHVKLELYGFTAKEAALYTINGNGADDYNDVEQPDNIRIREQRLTGWDDISLSPHSVNVLELK